MYRGIECTKTCPTIENLDSDGFTAESFIMFWKNMDYNNFWQYGMLYVYFNLLNFFCNIFCYNVLKSLNLHFIFFLFFSLEKMVSYIHVRLKMNYYIFYYAFFLTFYDPCLNFWSFYIHTLVSISFVFVQTIGTFLNNS